MDTDPIGFFDSGLGGASVLREALRLLPNESYIYYGDDARAPYGDLPQESIARCTMESVDRLLSLGVKALVIACNTATATCIDDVRAHAPVPVISVEPAIKPACALPGDGLVLALATAATTRLERYQSLRSRMPDPSRVVSVACPGLVERIERGITAEGAFDDLLDSYTSFLQNKEIDAIVLGCTHYVFIKKAIAAYAASHFGGECRLFDGNEATIRQLERVLRERDLLSPSEKGTVEFRTSGEAAQLRPIFLSLLGLA